MTVDASFAALGSTVRVIGSGPAVERARADVLDYHERLSRFLPRTSAPRALAAHPRARYRPHLAERAAEPVEPPPPGDALLCCARPEGDVVLDA